MLTKFEEWTKFPYEIREFTKLRYNFSMKFMKGRKASVNKPPNERTILIVPIKKKIRLECWFKQIDK